MTWKEVTYSKTDGCFLVEGRVVTEAQFIHLRPNGSMEAVL